jgi:hypothetical protein
LEYKVQNNVFVVEKLKEVQKTNFLEILCRALCENARQTYMFAVRFWTAHGKGNGFAVRLTLTHGKDDEQPNGVNVALGKKMFAVRHYENARQTILLPGVFYYRAPWKMRTAKLLFAVRPRICARQRLKRTAIIVFPVVNAGDLYNKLISTQILEVKLGMQLIVIAD